MTSICPRFTAVAVAAMLCALGAPALAAVNGPVPRMSLLVAEPTTDRLIVKYRVGNAAFPTAQAQMAAQVAANRQGVQIQHHRQMANGAQVFRMSRHLGRADALAMAANLRNGDANIDYVEPDRLHHAMLVPNDTLYAQQWSLFDSVGGIRAPAAWDKASGSGVTVAVLDTGVRPHVDLAAKLLPGYDFITDVNFSADNDGRDADASDPGDGTVANQCGAGAPASKSSWHGTHVAGIAAASGGNGIGVAGVAFGAKVLPLRVLGRCGGYSSDIADAIIWATGGTVSGVPANPNPAKVINLSLGGGGACDITTQNAINSARAKGAVVVVAAGNSNMDAANSSPANCVGVIAVGATGKTGGRSSYSNFGSKVTLSAPGGDSGDGGILSTWNAGTSAPAADNYGAMMGTSMATPVVSGVAALMFSANASLTPDQVSNMLKASARPFAVACSNCGAGIVDADAAVALAIAAKATAPTPAPTPTPTPAPAPAPAPAPTPAPVTGALPVTDAGVNDSLSAAQAVASLPALVSGTISSTADTDYFKFTLPAGKKLIATLTATSTTSGFGLAVYLSTGQQLLLIPGVVGRSQQMQLSNSGTAGVGLVIRVLRSSGTTGAYKLNLSY